MSNTIKNLPEIIENDDQYENAIKFRRKNIENFTNLGPPDLCYLTKSFQKTLKISFSKGTNVGFYHYNYGLCPSTPAAVSAYITSLLKEQEEDSNWFSNGKWTIIKAYYCMFDSFSKIDIHVEITIPGGMKLYGVTESDELINIDENIWEKGFISSVLRAMKLEKVPFIKIYRELNTLEELEFFFHSILGFIKKNDLAIENNELITSQGNKVLSIICKYLIRKRRYPIAINFFKQAMDLDIKHIIFLSEIFNSLGNHLDTIKLLAPVLNKNPHIICLIYQESYSLMKIKRYDLAGKLSKFLIQLAPECFEAWILLIEIYFQCKNYEAALLTLNVSPVGFVKETNNGILIPKDEKLIDNVTEPKEKGNSDYFYFNFETDTPDFKFTKANDEYKYIQQEFLEENKRMEEKILNLPGLKLTENEKKLYNILVSIEKEIGFEKLLQMRSNLFIFDENSNIGINKFKKNKNNKEFEEDTEDNSKNLEDYQIYDFGQIDEKKFFSTGVPQPTQITEIKENLKNNNSKIETTIKTPEVLPETDEEDSDKEHELPSFLKPEEEIKPKSQTTLKTIELTKKTSNKNPEINFEESKSVDQSQSLSISNSKAINLGFLSKDEEANPDLRSHSLSIRNNRLNKESHPYQNEYIDFSKKRLSSKTIDTLFAILSEDLNVMIEWSNEEAENQNRKAKKKDFNGDLDEDKEEDDDEADDIEDMKISGKLWVYRGMLAQRLLRNRFAENAYRKAVERGFSIFAWTQLLKIYSEIENYKACMVCIAEIMDQLQNDGVEKFNFLPKWIEEVLLEIISKSGYKELGNIMHELNLDDDVIEHLVKEAIYWKVEGSGNG